LVARVATVEGTLICGVPSAFAGGRRNVNLGRSVSSAWGSFPGRRTHRRQQVSSGRMRRGTSSACAKRTHSSRPRRTRAFSSEDTSFTRSRDPCTSIVTELLDTARTAAQVAIRNHLGGDASVLVSRSGNPTEVGANRHRDLDRRTNARLAARHREA
jgi:hypothetical protein